MRVDAIGALHPMHSLGSGSAGIHGREAASTMIEMTAPGRLLTQIAP
jgi:hypothetical protein